MAVDTEREERLSRIRSNAIDSSKRTVAYDLVHGGVIGVAYYPVDFLKDSSSILSLPSTGCRCYMIEDIIPPSKYKGGILAKIKFYDAYTDTTSLSDLLNDLRASPSQIVLEISECQQYAEYLLRKSMEALQGKVDKGECFIPFPDYDEPAPF